MSEQERQNQSLGNAKSSGGVPQGLEVLLKKAVVDSEFCELLLERRAAAAATIELQLDASEQKMIEAIPREHLKSIIAQTFVPVEQRRVFLGRLAAPMLAVLGVVVTGCMPTRGIDTVTELPSPNTPASTNNPPSTNSPTPGATRGIRPDHP
jgi:hypothetical protein